MANVLMDLVGAGRVFSVMDSAARTATPDTVQFTGMGRSVGLVLVVDATAITATPSVVVKIQGVDSVSGKTWDILTSAAIVATGTTVLRVRPGITASTNIAVADALPPVIRILATHGDADSITYSISAHLTH